MIITVLFIKELKEDKKEKCRKVSASCYPKDKLA